MKTLNVLLTAVGSTPAISVMKSFKMQHEYDVEVVGTDTNARDQISGSAFCDHFMTVPPAADEREYIGAILGLIEENDIDLFIPIVDEELEVVAKYSRMIEKETFLLLSPYETILTCNDKYLTCGAMKRNGLPILTTVIPGDISEIPMLLKDDGLSFPVIAKPRKGRGSQQVYRLDSKDDLVLLNRITDPIIQELAGGEEYVVDTFCIRNRIIGIITRKTSLWRAGADYRSEFIPDSPLNDYAGKVIQSMEFLGPVNSQWFFSDKGPSLLEINPRFCGATCFNSYCGHNYPLYALRIADSGDPGLPGKPNPSRMCRYWDEVYHPLT